MCESGPRVKEVDMRPIKSALLLFVSSIFAMATLYAVESSAGPVSCLYHSTTYDESLDKTCSDGETSVRGYAQAWSSNHLLTSNLLETLNLPHLYRPASTAIAVDSSGYYISTCRVDDVSPDGTSVGTWANCGSAVKFDLWIHTDLPPP
jgi:hypothetical protein